MAPHMIHHGFNPELFTLELVYVGIVVALCFLIYYRTREMYSLTKHKGIEHFRNAFLYFGLGFLFRFAHQLYRLVWEALDLGRPILGPRNFLFILFGYFSTMGILSLMMSTVWKKYKGKYHTLLLHSVAGITTVIAMITLSPQVLLLFQSVMMFFAVLFTLKNNKKKTALPIIYILLFAFWAVNILISGPWFWFSASLRAPAYIVGTVIFVIIYHKVNKWAT